MNPIVRHFLPSLTRGVYRYDDMLGRALTSPSEYPTFIEGKLRFLPLSLLPYSKRALGISDSDIEAIQPTRLGPIVTTGHQQRASEYFRSFDYFANARNGDDIAGKNYLEVKFVSQILAPILSSAGLRQVIPQRKVGPYFLDFAIEGERNYAIEVDGFGKFEHPGALDRFLDRQNYIIARGWQIHRFSYNQIMESPSVTQRQIYDIFRKDPRLASCLEARPTEDPYDLLATDSHDIIALVNDFYQVQDHFVFRSVTQEKENTYVIRDSLEYPLPVVAYSLNALYIYLSAIEKVVDVDFDLPSIDVWGAKAPVQIPLDSRITVAATREGPHDTYTRDAIKTYASLVPTPFRDGNVPRFREGLGPGEIHEYISPITSDLFGYPEGTTQFQDETLRRLCDRRDVLGIAATGSGKSLCFWLPALIRPGLVLVVSPLRSLMRDQQQTLFSYGIASMEFINSDVAKEQQQRILHEAKLGYIRMLYVAPERMRMQSFVNQLSELQSFVPITILAIDEAHCISEWGHDFRPSYLKLPQCRDVLRRTYPALQLVGLTATAGQQVEKDILRTLSLSDADVHRGQTSDRERFSYQVARAHDGTSKDELYRSIMTTSVPRALRHPDLRALTSSCNREGEKAVGLVFCIYADPHGQHSICDGISHYLYQTREVLATSREGLLDGTAPLDTRIYGTGPVRAFSSKEPTVCPRCKSYAYTTARAFPRDGADDDEEDEDGDINEVPARQRGMKKCHRCGYEFSGEDAKKIENWNSLTRQNQNDFKHGHFDIMVSTKGFGMGIDKGSVRFVVHTSMPSGIESWYQEVGRAGRDKERAHTVLLVDPPTEQCEKDLRSRQIKEPPCSYIRGCPHGHNNGLCDYGKQHMFIKRSYPSVISDALAAVRFMDRLCVLLAAAPDKQIVVKSASPWLSRHELAAHRLGIIGLISDYVISYQRAIPQLELTLPNLLLKESERSQSHLEQLMGKRLEVYFQQASLEKHLTIQKRRERCKPFGRLEMHLDDKKPLLTYDTNKALLNATYEHLIVLLNHVYTEVVKMRYDMLWNLMSVIDADKDNRCRRTVFVPHFDGRNSLGNDYRCKACDVCSPELDFPDIRVTPVTKTDVEKENILARLLHEDMFLVSDIEYLRALLPEFVDYSVSKYRQARAVLEGDPNNLTALFISREFSPEDERKANCHRLLETANLRPAPLDVIDAIFESSPREMRGALYLALDVSNSAVDCDNGWRLLIDKAKQPSIRGDGDARTMAECLKFFLFVDKEMNALVDRLRTKANDMERAFYA